MCRCTGSRQRIWQSRQTLSEFVDSLIPLEVEAELAGGVLPADVDRGSTTPRRIELGLYATNMPKSVGGPG